MLIRDQSPLSSQEARSINKQKSIKKEEGYLSVGSSQNNVITLQNQKTPVNVNKKRQSDASDTKQQRQSSKTNKGDIKQIRTFSQDKGPEKLGYVEYDETEDIKDK